MGASDSILNMQYVIKFFLKLLATNFSPSITQDSLCTDAYFIEILAYCEIVVTFMDHFMMKYNTHYK